MYWFSTKAKCGPAKADTTWLKDAIKNGKGGRSLQAIEVYQKNNKEKIQERVTKEMEELGAKTNKERMAVRRQVVAEMWKE
jgi:hypothetical protein